MVNATSGEEGCKLVASGKRRAPAPSKGLQMQNRFTLLKAEENSDVATSKEPGSPNSKSCKITRK